MEIIIGRDKDTKQLRISAGTQSKLFGTIGSVPDYVSRQHVKIIVDDSGHFTLINMNPSNMTYVNGITVESKVVTEEDKVELGPTRYLLDWSMVNQFIPTLIDIRPLEAVWENYHRTKMKYQIAERRFNALRSATGVITMIAIVLGMVGGRSVVYFILYGSAVAITLAFTIKAYIASSKVPQQNDELDKKFKKTYVCPNPKCHHFMGFNSYDVLSQNKACPYCKGQYKK